MVMRWQKILILVVYILAVDRVYAKPKKGKGKGKGKKKGGVRKIMLKYKCRRQAMQW